MNSMVNFTDEEKIAMFDEIASHFYEANFGQMNKKDFDIMMFHFFMEKLVKETMDDDGVIRNYNKCSNYNISKALGIPENKVNKMKLDSQLKYPIDFDWKKSFAYLIENAKYEEKTHKVIMRIPDPNLYNEVKNVLEEQGGYIESQLSRDVLKIRVEYFVALALALDDETTKKAVIDELKEQFQSDENDAAVFDENEIGKSLIRSSVDITTLFANLATALPVGASVIKSLTRLFG